MDHFGRYLNPDNTEIVSGKATGADSLGERWAGERGIPVKGFPAEWGKYGPSAGPRRNKAMAEYGTHLVAFWDGKSRGTENMIKNAEAKGLTVKIIYYDRNTGKLLRVNTTNATEISWA